MRVFSLTGIIVALFVSTLFINDWAAAQGGPGWHGGQRGPRMMCAERFGSMDTDKNERVDAVEFAAVPHRRGDAQQVFKSMDTDSDEVLTKEEFCAGKGRCRGRWQ